MESIRVRKSRASSEVEITEDSSDRSKLVEAFATEVALDVEDLVVGIVDKIVSRQLK